MDLIAASTNAGKIKDLAALLTPKEWKVISLFDMGYTEEIDEYGSTLEENARIKARAIHVAFPGKWVLADDSGVIVPAIGGEPGVQSTLYSGIPRNPSRNNQKLLKRIQEAGLKEPNAAFETWLVLVEPSGVEHISKGRLKGRIASENRGTNGFGYDSIFIPDVVSDRTLAELTESERSQISHRTQALNGLLPVLLNALKT